MSYFVLYQASTGTIYGFCLERTRFLKYTVIQIASGQYCVDKPKSTSIEYAVSRMVYIIVITTNHKDQ